jgi:hypothetical protein
VNFKIGRENRLKLHFISSYFDEMPFYDDRLLKCRKRIDEVVFLKRVGFLPWVQSENKPLAIEKDTRKTGKRILLEIVYYCFFSAPQTPNPRILFFDILGFFFNSQIDASDLLKFWLKYIYSQVVDPPLHPEVNPCPEWKCMFRKVPIYK